MKNSLLFSLVALALSASQVVAQDSMFLLWNRDYPEAPVFDARGTPLSSYYLGELWGAATPNSLVPAMDWTGSGRTIVSFSGGYLDGGAAMIVPAQFINGGDSWLQLRAWDSRLGATYEDVAALGIGGYGESNIFLADGANPYMALPDLPAPLIGLESFSVRAVVPEPSTWTLLAAGGAIMLLGAARKKMYASDVESE